VRALIAVPAYPLFKQGRVAKVHDEAVVVPARYIHALRQAGAAEGIVVPASTDGHDLGAMLDRFDGVLLLGGGDLEPATYGQDLGGEVHGINSERDSYELDLCRAAIERGMPVLAICRGHQVLNVALGGTLDQHITGRDGLLGHGLPGIESGAEMHEVDIEPESRMAAAMGTTRATVSSHHHQAIDQVGDGLNVVALSADGIVEGVELADPDAGWVVGAQWHPEDTAPDDPAQQGLFDTLVTEAQARNASR
jgi:putative glutamine amidotransferase